MFDFWHYYSIAASSSSIFKKIKCKNCSSELIFLSKIRYNEWVSDKEKMQCFFCNSLYCCLPTTEQQLRILQDKFLEEGREEKYIIQLTKILMDYCGSLIKKYFSHIPIVPKRFSYYRDIAVSFTVENYYSKPDFKITTSFGSFLILKICQAIYGKQEYSSGDETLDYVLPDGHLAVYEDTKSNYLQSVEDQEHLINLYQQIIQIIDQTSEYCSSPVENYIRLLNINNFLEKGENSINNFFENYSEFSKYSIVKSLEILKNFLKNN